MTQTISTIVDCPVAHVGSMHVYMTQTISTIVDSKYGCSWLIQSI